MELNKVEYIIKGFRDAFQIVLRFDGEFISIVVLSLKISIISTLIACIIGIPVSLFIGTTEFRGKRMITTIMNTLMSIPTVVIGLLLYSLLSRKGPMGGAGLLFTPVAIIIGQSILAFPIVSAISLGGIKSLGDRPFVAAKILGAGTLESLILFIREARFIVIAGIMAAFGRVISEVGISMMVGGNIRFYTRNITTAIALETSKGDFGIGIALGMVLLMIAFLVNFAVYHFQRELL
jgi:tungstate transport system permease protein